MDLLKLIAETLLEYETITKEQIDYLVKNGHMPEEALTSDEAFGKAPKLEDLSLDELKAKAKEKGIENYEEMTKEELISSLQKRKRRPKKENKSEE